MNKQEIKERFFELYIIRNSVDFVDKLKFMEIVFNEQTKKIEDLEKEVKRSNGMSGALCGIIDNLKSKLDD